MWSDDPESKQFEHMQDNPEQPFHLLGGAWWHDLARPDLGRAAFISALVTGMTIGGVAAADTLPTWIRVGVLLVVLGLLAAFWIRALRQ